MRNKLVFIVSMLAASAITPVVHASQYFNEQRVGVEAIQTNQDFKNGFGKKLFKKNPQNYSLFAGFKFSEYFGAEVGYEFQPKKTRDFVQLVAGDQIPGGILIGANAFNNITGISYKSRHPYLGLFGEHVTHLSKYKVRLQALVGASLSNVTAQYVRASDNLGVIPNGLRTYSKSKMVPMVKLSAIGEITHNVGVRVSLNYRNMSAFKMVSAQSNTAIIKMKDSYGIGLGLTYLFS